MTIQKIGPFVIASCLLSAMSQGAEASRLVSRLEAGRKQVVVAYGTSLTQGGAWVKQMEKALNETYPGLVTVINSGGSGQWSEWGVLNLQKKVIDNKPVTADDEL